MLRKIALVATLPIVLVGCGTDNPKASSPSTSPSSEATSSSTTTPSPTDTPSPSASGVPANVGDRALKVGQWREGSGVRTRVRSLTQPSDIHPPSYLVGDNDAIGALADVEMCVRKSETEGIKGSLYDSFHVYDKSGGQYSQASASWDAWPPRPQFPNDDVNVRPGRCVRGWILFSVPKSVRVASIANDGQDEATAEWNVG